MHKDQLEKQLDAFVHHVVNDGDKFAPLGLVEEMAVKVLFYATKERLDNMMDAEVAHLELRLQMGSRLVQQIEALVRACGPGANATPCDKGV